MASEIAEKFTKKLKGLMPLVAFFIWGPWISAILMDFGNELMLAAACLILRPLFSSDDCQKPSAYFYDIMGVLGELLKEKEAACEN